jgi:hypothetical protein
MCFRYGFLYRHLQSGHPHFYGAALFGVGWTTASLGALVDASTFQTSCIGLLAALQAFYIVRFSVFKEVCHSSSCKKELDAQAYNHLQYKHMHTHTHAQTRPHFYTHTHTNTRYTHTHIHKHTHKHTHTHVFTHTYALTHTHTHTYSCGIGISSRWPYWERWQLPPSLQSVRDAIKHIIKLPTPTHRHHN